MSSYSYYNGPNQSQFQCKQNIKKTYPQIDFQQIQQILELSVPLQGSYSVDPKTTSVAKQQYSSNLDINSGTMDYMAPKTEFNEIYYSQVPQEKYSYSPNKVLGASNNQSPSPYFSQKLQPYNITQLHETEFEQILAGKQNEIEYWKQKNIKLQKQINEYNQKNFQQKKQLDESENKVNYLSNEYDKLRVQHLSLQESQESSKQSLYLEIQVD